MVWLLFLAGLAAGVVLAREYKTLIGFVRNLLARARVIEKRVSPRIRKGRDRLQRNPLPAPSPNPSIERVAVLLTAGQSNAANHGGVNETNDHLDNPAILNLIDSKCYIARHPLLGATGEHQSPWIETARLLIASGYFDKVVIIATGIGGTGLYEWSPGGEFHHRLLDRIDEAKAAGLSPTHFLWHQGEQEGVLRKSSEDYLAMFKAMVASIRQHVDVPVILALATRCGANGPFEPIRRAQRQAAMEIPNASFIDSDALGLAYRYDGCHFTKQGQNEMARLYASAIGQRYESPSEAGDIPTLLKSRDIA